MVDSQSPLQHQKAGQANVLSTDARTGKLRTAVLVAREPCNLIAGERGAAYRFSRGLQWTELS